MSPYIVIVGIFFCGQAKPDEFVEEKRRQRTTGYKRLKIGSLNGRKKRGLLLI